LFYQEGVQTVGIDRVIERAGVAKATLYSTFGSKDELIRAYLERRHKSLRERTMSAIERRASPRERLLAVFDVLSETVAARGFHGCAFVNASAEVQPGSMIYQTITEHRGWLRGLLVDLARQAEADEPQRLAAQLQMLYDGVMTSARIDREPGTATAARAAAEALLQASAPRASSVRGPAD
jgi:AcrR family transcriptional regulator